MFGSIISSGFGNAKPDPGIYYAALRQLGVPVEQAVSSVIALLGGSARAVGMKTITLITTKKPERIFIFKNFPIYWTPLFIVYHRLYPVKIRYVQSTLRCLTFYHVG
jgi:FMN phosphatase YigB (HAD superfamily)